MTHILRQLRQLLWMVAAAICIGPALASAETVYTFSVVPQIERRMLFSIWQPILDELQKRTGQRFELVTALSVNEYDQEVRRGIYDFVYVNPYVMVSIEKTPGYQPLIRDSQSLHGILVVRKDSPIQRVAELQGKSLAVPALQALGASLLLRAELDRQFGIRMNPVIAKTHGSVFLHVINGLTDAGGSVQKALSTQDAHIQASLRALYRTGDVPSHPIAAHPRVPEAVREQVRQAFIAMSADPAGKALLGKIPMEEAVAAQAQDYHVLRDLQLENYLQQ